MTTAFANRTIRALAATAIAMLGLAGLSACTTDDSGAPGASSPNPTQTSTSLGEPAIDEAPGEFTKCTEEQVATMSAPTDVTVPSEDVANANTDFDGAAMIADLPTVCVISFVDAEATGNFAVLSGGAATLATVSANLTAAGAEVTEEDGAFKGSFDGLTVFGFDFSKFTQETAGFENTDDLVLIATNRDAG